MDLKQRIGYWFLKQHWCAFLYLSLLIFIQAGNLWTTYCIIHISAHPGIFQGLLIPILFNFQLLISLSGDGLFNDAHNKKGVFIYLPLTKSQIPHFSY